MIKDKRQIIIIAHNIRSTHNVGSIFRTAEGLGIKEIIISGYTPFPKVHNESFIETGRLPHLANKIHDQIHKTALDAEDIVPFSLSKDIKKTIQELKDDDFKVVALEQTKDSILLPELETNNFDKIALILGEEVNGVSQEILDLADLKLEIPMFGKKESFNVSVATGIALYKIACE